MARIGAYKPETARKVLDAVMRHEQSGFVLHGQDKGYGRFTETPVIFKANQTIPPYGCIQFTGTHTNNGRTYLNARSPLDSVGSFGPYGFNSHLQVAAGDYGVAWDSMVMRAMSTGFTAGQWLAPVPGSFSIGQSYVGMFTVIGIDSSTPQTSGIARVMRGGCDIAEIAVFTYGSDEDWNLSTFYHGFDPSFYFNGLNGPSEIPVIDPLDGCWEEGEKALAHFDKNDQRYVIFSSQSGVQGDVDQKEVTIDLQFTGGQIVANKIKMAVACWETAGQDAIDTTDCDEGEEEPTCECIYTWSGETWNKTTDTCGDCSKTCTGPPLFPGSTPGETSQGTCSGG